MNITVIGASGGVGRHAVERALADGHRVTAAVRNPGNFRMQHEQLQVAQCDTRNPVAVSAAVRGADAVLCTVGADSNASTTLYSTSAEHILRGMTEHGVRRLVFLSNFGVLDERSTDWRSALLLFLIKRVIRDTLTDHRRALELMRRCAVQWTAVRPMALTDAPSLGRYRVSIEGLPGKGWRIARADVAEFMLRQLHDDHYVCKAPALAY
jgi:putative NADH-flavin reductase